MKTREEEFMSIAEGKPSESFFKEVNIAEVNLIQLHRNLDIIKNKLKHGVKFMAVVKGDAYGHGLVPIAEELERCGCDAIGVVRLTEAMALRKGGIRIPVVVLAPLLPSQGSLVVDYNITTMVDNERMVKALEENASKKNKIVNVHIKVNTGLNRYGVKVEDVLKFIHMINEKYLHIKIEGIYTHFKDPENNKEFTYDQLKKFNIHILMNNFNELLKGAKTLFPRLISFKAESYKANLKKLVGKCKILISFF